jgi:glycosyltransferase involved in cell wall biosynthesis
LALHRLRARADPRLHARFFGAMPREVVGLRRLIRREQVGIVQVHGDTNPHGAIAARLEGVAVVWQLYDTRTPPPLRRVTMPLVLRLADVITTWGEQLGREYPGATSLGERWISVFPPVDGAQFAPDPARRASARAELGLGADDVAVACIGMRNPSKGHDRFVRALAIARRGRPSLVGRILGPDSPAHADYERRFRAEAQSLGLLDGHALDIRDAGSRVPELLPAFDILALSSVPRSEGMPTVILEAMACGIPVVATHVGAVAELVEAGSTGLVVPPEDDEALAAGLARLASDAELRAHLGEAGRRRFDEVFQLERLADRHARAYELAVSHARTRRRAHV